MRSINVRSELVDLFARQKRIHENRGCSRTTNCAVPHKFHATVALDARIVRRDLDWKTRSGIIARPRQNNQKIPFSWISLKSNLHGTIDKFTETLARHARNGEIEIVIDKLAPLHQHVRENWIGRDFFRSDDSRRNETGTRFRKSIVLHTPAPTC